MTILACISKTITDRENLARVKMISKSSSTKVFITLCLNDPYTVFTKFGAMIFSVEH